LCRFGDEWQAHFGPTRSQHQWFEFGRVARRLKMYEEAEAFLEMCLGYGYSRAAYYEMTGLFLEAKMLHPALKCLHCLAGADDDDEVNELQFSMGFGNRASTGSTAAASTTASPNGTETTRQRRFVPKLVLEQMKAVVDRFGIAAVADAIGKFGQDDEEQQQQQQDDSMEAEGGLPSLPNSPWPSSKDTRVHRFVRESFERMRQIYRPYDTNRDDTRSMT